MTFYANCGATMRRSICVTEPSYCLAGETSTFKFIYTPATNIPKGAKLRFDLVSRGRPIDWEVPRALLKEKSNLIWAQMPDGKILNAKEVEKPSDMGSFFEFILPAEVKSGENLTIILGSSLKGKEHGSRSQTLVQRRRPFELYIDPRGKTDFREHETFHVDVRGNTLENIRIIAPSIVGKNKRFDVIVRFEDKYGNLTNNAAEGTLIELSYEHLRENLNWKLFVPETGFINLPNLYFNEVGVYKIQLKNLKTGQAYFSAPIKCFPEADLSIYWGLLHGESEKMDSAENIEACLRHFRDEKAVQFYSSSSFENAEETSPEIWKNLCQQVSEFNEDHRFNTFLGFQYFDEEDGLRQIFYLKDNKPILRKKDGKTSSLKKLYKAVSQKEILSVPCFTMAKNFPTNFTDFNPDFERVVEIYNAWGSSECSAKEGNLRPIRSSSKSGVFENENNSLLQALKRNCRFGFVAGGLDDRGVYSEFYESDQVQYSPGLTAILATEQTKEAMIAALQARSCYATTGERIIMGLAIAGSGIGTELNTKNKPGLVINRHITGYVAGTAPLKEVVLLRNGVPFKTFHSKDYFLDFTLDDMEHLSTVLLSSPDDRPPFVFYYLRVVQQDGHIGWTSPIWVDAPDVAISSPKKTKKKQP
jgi:hypothetical protein